MTDVFLLWEQANHAREVTNRVGRSNYQPRLIGVFANADTPNQLAFEYNKVHGYSTRWVSTVPVEES